MSPRCLLIPVCCLCLTHGIYSLCCPLLMEAGLLNYPLLPGYCFTQLSTHLRPLIHSVVLSSSAMINSAVIYCTLRPLVHSALHSPRPLVNSGVTLPRPLVHTVVPSAPATGSLRCPICPGHKFTKRSIPPRQLIYSHVHPYSATDSFSRPLSPPATGSLSCQLRCPGRRPDSRFGTALCPEKKNRYKFWLLQPAPVGQWRGVGGGAAGHPQHCPGCAGPRVAPHHRSPLPSGRSRWRSRLW
jgi:hypothetical protein